MKLTWEYIGEELAVFWESPYGSGKEKIASFWWPLHPPDKTTEVESVFESIASWACLYGALSTKSRCICNPIIPGAHAAMCPENFPPAEPSGNTGELPVCRKCNGTKRVMFDQVGEEWKVRPATGLENGARCPDCSAAQPARHSEALSSFTAYCQAHPSERFWQALRNWSRWGYILGAQTRDGGTIDTFNLEGLDGTHAAHEQAEREGK